MPGFGFGHPIPPLIPTFSNNSFSKVTVVTGTPVLLRGSIRRRRMERADNLSDGFRNPSGDVECDWCYCEYAIVGHRGTREIPELLSADLHLHRVNGKCRIQGPSGLRFFLGPRQFYIRVPWGIVDCLPSGTWNFVGSANVRTSLSGKRRTTGLIFSFIQILLHVLDVPTPYYGNCLLCYTISKVTAWRKSGSDTRVIATVIPQLLFPLCFYFIR